MSHTLEIEFISLIQEFRHPLLDIFFKLLDFFDRQEFFFILIPAVWLGYGWKWGLRLFYILFLSSITNHLLKQIFLSPRPFHIAPSLGIIQVTGYGFPSGAAQTVILLSGLLLNVWKSHWRWLVVFSYIILISFSRVYLGIHFPTDIVAGWFVGFLLWVLFTYIRPIIELNLMKLRGLSLFILSQLVPLFFLFFQYNPVIIPTCVCAMGLAMGLFLNRYLGYSSVVPKTKKQKVLSMIIGVTGTFFIYFLLSYLPSSLFIKIIKFLIVSLWITTGSIFICCKTLMKGDKNG